MPRTGPEGEFGKNRKVPNQPHTRWRAARPSGESFA